MSLSKEECIKADKFINDSEINTEYKRDYVESYFKGDAIFSEKIFQEFKKHNLLKLKYESENGFTVFIFNLDFKDFPGFISIFNKDQTKNEDTNTKRELNQESLKKTKRENKWFHITKVGKMIAWVVGLLVSLGMITVSALRSPKQSNTEAPNQLSERQATINISMDSSEISIPE